MKHINVVITTFLFVVMGICHTWALSGSGTETTPYLISNSTDWTSFFDEVNKDKTVYGKLTASFETVETPQIQKGHAIIDLGNFVVTRKGVNGAVLISYAKLTINASDNGGLVNNTTKQGNAEYRWCIAAGDTSQTFINRGSYQNNAEAYTCYFCGDATIKNASIQNDGTGSSIFVSQSANATITNTKARSKGLCLYMKSSGIATLRNCDFRSSGSNAIHIENSNGAVNVRSGIYGTLASRAVFAYPTNTTLLKVVGGFYTQNMNGVIDSKICETTPINITDGTYQFICKVTEKNPTITFDPNGGQCTTQTLQGTYNSSFTLPIPTRNGYSFVNWEDEDGNVVSGSPKFLESMTLTAKWEVNATLGGDVITDYSDVVLTDDKELIVKSPIHVDKISYSRKDIKNKWGTIVLPFDVVIDENEHYDFYKISSFSNSTLMLDGITGTLQSGTPAFIRMSEGAKNNQDRYEVTLIATDATVNTAINTTTVDGLELTGAYVVTDVTNENGYILSNNSLWNILTVRGDEKVYCAPYRAYIKSSINGNANVRQLSFGVNDNNNLSDVKHLNALNSEDATYYDINGQRINELKKGFNIIKLASGDILKVVIK